MNTIDSTISRTENADILIHNEYSYNCINHTQLTAELMTQLTNAEGKYYHVVSPLLLMARVNVLIKAIQKEKNG